MVVRWSPAEGDIDEIPMHQHSIVLNGHKTSLSLEDQLQLLIWINSSTTIGY
jgi:predicted DNA-binding ribbon-helix-helix protein